MNFLAHIFLSGRLEDVQLGNFIGDFVKGNQVSGYPSGMQAGIVLHRFIDSYTDSHQVVKRSKIRLRGEFGHYAPVIVDVFYDHFLAKEWGRFHEEDLKDFTEAFYSRAKKASAMLPAKASEMLKYMSADNWLYHYRLINGIRMALTGMAGRTTFDSHMERAHQHLESHYAEFRDEFNEFFPHLIVASQQHLEELKTRFSL